MTNQLEEQFRTALFGSPPSDAHQPSRDELLNGLVTMVDYITNALSDIDDFRVSLASGAKSSVGTLAELNAITTDGNGTARAVIGESSANDGYYRYDTSSSSWIKMNIVDHSAEIDALEILSAGNETNITALTTTLNSQSFVYKINVVSPTDFTIIRHHAIWGDVLFGFTRRTDASINQDVFALNEVWGGVSLESGFVKETQYAGGSVFENATREVGAVDYSGGIHGDEELTSEPVLKIGGVTIDLSAIATYESNTLSLSQNTNIFAEDDGTDQILSLDKVHTFIPSGEMKLDCDKTYSRNITVTSDYFAMVPVTTDIITRIMTDKGLISRSPVDPLFGYESSTSDFGLKTVGIRIECENGAIEMSRSTSTPDSFVSYVSDKNAIQKFYPSDGGTNTSNPHSFTSGQNILAGAVYKFEHTVPRDIILTDAALLIRRQTNGNASVNIEGLDFADMQVGDSFTLGMSAYDHDGNTVKLDGRYLVAGTTVGSTSVTLIVHSITAVGVNSDWDNVSTVFVSTSGYISN